MSREPRAGLPHTGEYHYVVVSAADYCPLELTRSVAAKPVAGNPDTWMLHCHNGYHMGTGMMTIEEKGRVP